MTSTSEHATEHEDLLRTLAQRRYFLRFTARDLTDEQAALRPTVSELSIGGLIKHVTATESGWVDFIVRGPAALTGPSVDWDSEGVAESWLAGFRMQPGETLAGLLDGYEAVAARTADVVAGLRDLGTAQPLPEAPWFEKGAFWSARRALLHIVAETAQHAGHADIIRESIDGSKTMG